MNSKKIFQIILIAVVIISLFRIIGKITAKKVQEEREIPVVAVNPRIGDLSYKVVLTGDVKAAAEVSVRPRVAGRVEEIYVNEGDYVEKGAKLLSFVSGISKDNEIYEDMIVRAPIAGVIGMKLIKEGEQVTTQPTGGINPVLMLYDMENLKIYANVSEKDYPLLSAGAPASIKLDAFPEETFSGRINNIRPVIDSLSRTTQVEIILPNPGNRIKPGMFAKIELVLSKKSKVLILPFDSILGENEKYVYTSVNKTAARKPVTLGMQEDENIEITSGLSAADRVIVQGQRVIKDGAKIVETAGR